MIIKVLSYSMEQLRVGLNGYVPDEYRLQEAIDVIRIVIEEIASAVKDTEAAMSDASMKALMNSARDSVVVCLQSAHDYIGDDTVSSLIALEIRMEWTQFKRTR